MIIYNPAVYINTTDNSSRFVLGTKGIHPLCVIGVNPSKADEKKPDLTLRKVIGFADRYGFDSFFMFNLYPERATDPKRLSKECELGLLSQNIAHIRNILIDLKEIILLAAWGGTIDERDYLMDCLLEIHSSLLEFDMKWVKLGDMTVSNHPRHPSRAPYKLELTAFDISGYLEMHRSE